MQFHLSFYLLCIVVLQQVINVTSMASFEKNSDNEMIRLPSVRGLRAPLMGRSIATISNDSKHTSASDEEELIQVNKRRYGWILSARRRWMGVKRRRGPLFG